MKYWSAQMGGMLLVLFCATAAAAAQETPLVQSTTRLVQVNVVVLSKDRKPVEGLTARDFTILERGRPQRIAFFSTENARQREPVQLPPNVFSNRSDIRGSDTPSSVTVILLDLLNTSWTNQIYARDRVLRFLSQVRREDRIGLYTLGRGLRVLHDFTSDTESLIAMLHQFRGQHLTALQDSKADPDVLRQLEEHGFSTDAEKRIANYNSHSRIVNTLRSLEAIGSRLAGVPGRKNLIWVSGSFPLMVSSDDIRSPILGVGRRGFDIDQRSYLSELEHTMRTLSQANVAVHPVDARGLMAPPVAADRPGAPGLAAMAAENIETLTKIADRTGGTAYYNRNDLDRAVREVFEESAVSYTLAYYADSSDLDGTWREIKVAVGRPGVTVRHRRGYYALPNPPIADENAMKEELRAAVWSPVDATGIGITARVDSAGPWWKVMLQIDPSTVTLTPVEERWKGRLDIAVVARSAEGRNLDARFDNIGMNLRRETYESALKGGILYETQLQRREGVAFLKVAVRDASSGLTGTLTIPTSRVK